MENRGVRNLIYKVNYQKKANAITNTFESMNENFDQVMDLLKNNKSGIL